MRDLHKGEKREQYQTDQGRCAHSPGLAASTLWTFSASLCRRRSYYKNTQIPDAGLKELALCATHLTID